MRLTELAVDMAMVDPRMHDTEISGLTADSRAVRPGYLFAALPSVSANSGTDGRDFIGDAVKRGAVAVLAPEGTQIGDLTDETPYLITDENPRWRLSQFAARFFENQPAHIVGVTGTNGKSSVAGFARQIWRRLDHASGAIGTGDVKLVANLAPSPTKLSPASLKRQAAEAKAAEAKAAEAAEAAKEEAAKVMAATRLQAASRGKAGREIAENKKHACCNYRVNMKADNFGECLCGWMKASHSEDALATGLCKVADSALVSPGTLQRKFVQKEHAV